MGGQYSGYPASVVTGTTAFAPFPSAGRGEVTAHDTAAWSAQPYGGTDPAMLRGFELTGGGGRPPPPVGGFGADPLPKRVFLHEPPGKDNAGSHKGDIHGKGPPLSQAPPQGYGFSQGTDPWGQATWDHAWNSGQGGGPATAGPGVPPTTAGTLHGEVGSGPLAVQQSVYGSYHLGGGY